MNQNTGLKVGIGSITICMIHADAENFAIIQPIHTMLVRTVLPRLCFRERHRPCYAQAASAMHYLKNQNKGYLPYQTPYMQDVNVDNFFNRNVDLMPRSDDHPIWIRFSQIRRGLVCGRGSDRIRRLHSVLAAFEGVVPGKLEIHGVFRAYHLVLESKTFEHLRIVAPNEYFVKRSVLGCRVVYIFGNASFVRPAGDLTEAGCHATGPVFALVAVNEDRVVLAIEEQLHDFVDGSSLCVNCLVLVGQNRDVVMCYAVRVDEICVRQGKRFGDKCDNGLKPEVGKLRVVRVGRIG
jgi:hypothetical protein